MVSYKTFVILLFLAIIFTTSTQISSADEIQDLENKLQYLKEKKSIDLQINELQDQLKAIAEKYKINSQTATNGKKADIPSPPVMTKTVPETKDEISAQQFIDLVVDNTLLSQASNGNRFKTFFQPKGRLVLNGETGGFFDEGTWEIAQNKVCVQWKKIRKGKYFCNKDFNFAGDMISYTQELINEKITAKIAKGTDVDYEDVSK